jgi:hypothetical protein
MYEPCMEVSSRSSRESALTKCALGPKLGAPARSKRRTSTARRPPPTSISSVCAASPRTRATGKSCFAACCSTCCAANRDDHLKNHALLYAEDGWRLGPAFDVVPQVGIIERVQAIAVGVLGGIPTIENCSSHCGEFGLSTDAAQVMADRMIERMRDWRHDFRELGVPAATMERLARVFSPELAK